MVASAQWHEGAQSILRKRAVIGISVAKLSRRGDDSKEQVLHISRINMVTKQRRKARGTPILPTYRTYCTEKGQRYMNG